MHPLLIESFFVLYVEYTGRRTMVKSIRNWLFLYARSKFPKPILNFFNRIYSIWGVYFPILITICLLFSMLEPKIIPITFAAIIIGPLKYTMEIGLKNVSEDDYASWSPIISNLNNFNFVGVSGFLIISTIYLTTTPIAWSNLGILSFSVGTVSVIISTWAESFYEKNYYFNQWHILERGLLIFLGFLVILSPSFILLFILFHKLNLNQFEYPTVSKFSSTHTALPNTVLFIIASFTIVDRFFHIEPMMVSFLLLCGIGAHYFHSGIAKIEFGPTYYIFNNNPSFLGLNAYKNGWLDSLPEKTVAQLGVKTERIKPILNIAVLIIEIGAIFIMLSYELAIIIIFLAILLHLSILISTGDYFWRWIYVDVFLIIGLLIAQREANAIVFDDASWFIYSLPFIMLAAGWMNPKELGWLDSPVHQYLTLEGTLTSSGDKINIHPNFLGPFCDPVTQGFSGKYTFILGSRPTVTYCMGATKNQNLNKQIQNIYPDKPPKPLFNQILNNYGENPSRKHKKEDLEKLLKIYLNKETKNSIFSRISAPNEWYMEGIPDDENILLENLGQIELIRVDGIWTKEGFYQINTEKIMALTELSETA